MVSHSFQRFYLWFPAFFPMFSIDFPILFPSFPKLQGLEGVVPAPRVAVLGTPPSQPRPNRWEPELGKTWVFSCFFHWIFHEGCKKRCGSSKDFFTTWFLLAIFEEQWPLYSPSFQGRDVRSWWNLHKFTVPRWNTWNMVIWMVNDEESWTTLLYSGYNHH